MAKAMDTTGPKVVREGERYRLMPRSDREWLPYERQWTETSLHPCMSRMPRSLYKLRWMAWYPFQRRILWGTYTAGEAVFLMATIVALGLGAYYSWHDIYISGQVAAIPLVLSFTLACRNSIWTFLLGLPYERALFWHKLMASLSVILGAYHGLLSWYYGHQGSHRVSAQHVDKQAEQAAESVGERRGMFWSDVPDEYIGSWKLSMTDHHFVIGWLLELAMLLMVLTSFIPRLRRIVFERWLFIHFFLIITIVVFSYIHNIQTLAVGLGIYLLDLLLRYVWMAGIRNPKRVEMVALPGDVVRIAWPKKDFHYMGGQYVFLCIPDLSWYEWHPFSLSSSPDNDMVYLHIRVLGDWTRALHTLATRKALTQEGSMELKTTTAYIEGPYGAPSLDYTGDRHTMFLLISGGIGVTPMQSVLNDLLSQQKRGRPLKLVWFLWTVRDKHMIETVLDYDKAYADSYLPKALPSSFSPDLISQHQRLSTSIRLGPPEAALQVADEGMAGQKNGDQNIYDEDFLHTEFYLSNPRGSVQAHEGNIAPERQSCLRFGRPDLSATVMEAARVASERSPVAPRLAIMCCGPPSLTKDMELISHKLNGSYGVLFEFHKEMFDF